MKHKNKKFIIHPLTVAFYLITIAFSDPKIALCALFCSTIHELGHYFSAVVLGYSIKSFILYPFGAEMKLCGFTSYKKDITVSLFGPVMNIVAALVGCVFNIGNFFIIYNITLAVLNLLPINHLDGGNVMASLLMLICDPDRAERVVSIISFLILLITWIISVYIFMMLGGSPSLFFICIMLFASTFLRE